MESLSPLFTSTVSSGQIPCAVPAASSLNGRFDHLKAFGRTFCEADSPAWLPMPRSGWRLRRSFSPPSRPCNASTKGSYLWTRHQSCLAGIEDTYNFEGLGREQTTHLGGSEEADFIEVSLLHILANNGHILFGWGSTTYEVLRLRNRVLLSHTSGLVYEFTSPGMQKYLKHKGEEFGFRELYASHPEDPLVRLCKGVAPVPRRR
jgi:hypothetical protein